MAALTGANWTLKSYTNSVWTTLVTGPATVASVIFANTAAAAVNVEMRLFDTSASPQAALSTLLPTAAIAASDGAVYDARVITVEAGQALQVRADAAGVEFTGCGGA